MKNDAIAVHGSDALPAPWRDALTLLDRDLLRRGTAERTRAVYGRDADELAALGGALHARSRGRRLPVAAPLRRPARRARARAAHDRAQARRAAGAVPRARRARRRRGQPRGPARLAQAPAAPPARAQARRRRRAAGPHPGLDAARDPRPRAVRGRLRLRPARGGAGRPRPHVARLRRGAGPRGGQGRQDPLRARRGARARRRPRATWSAPGRRWTPAQASPRCSSPRAAGDSPRRTSGAVCGRGRGAPRRRARSTRTPSGIRSRLIFWREVPIYVPSRRCSATRPSRRPRSTLG